MCNCILCYSQIAFLFRFMLLQVSTKNRVELLENKVEDQIDKLADKLGISPVGWIFTDLIADDLTKGTVKHFRGNIVGSDHKSYT